MNVTVKIYKKGDKLPELPGKEFFHSNTFFHLNENSANLSPVLITIHNDEILVAKLCAVLIRSKRLFPRSWFTVGYIFEEPEFFTEKDKNEILDILLSTLLKEIKRKCLYIEFVRIWKIPMFGYKMFRKHHFFPVDKIYIQNNFRKKRDVWKQTSNSKRRQANKGINSGTTVFEVSSIEDIDKWFETAHQIYSPRLMRHLPPLKFFHAFYNEVILNKKGIMFLARYKDKIIGGMICIFSGDTMHEWYTGSANKLYHHQYPGVLLTLYALDYCQKNGYVFFNFKDAISPFHRSTIKDFKIQFGGKQRNSKRWFRIRWKWLNKLLTKIYL